MIIEAGDRIGFSCLSWRGSAFMGRLTPRFFNVLTLIFVWRASGSLSIRHYLSVDSATSRKIPSTSWLGFKVAQSMHIYVP